MTPVDMLSSATTYLIFALLTVFFLVIHTRPTREATVPEQTPPQGHAAPLDAQESTLDQPQRQNHNACSKGDEPNLDQGTDQGPTLSPDAHKPNLAQSEYQGPRASSNATLQSLNRIKYSKPDACRQILSCEGNGSGDQNILEPVVSRALPNERLVRAFGIDNAFTTTEDRHRIPFKETARKKISNVDWGRIAQKAPIIIADYMNMGCCDGLGHDLVGLVRSVSFAITLQVLYEIDPLTLSPFTVRDITSSINDLWVKSKLSTPLSPLDKDLLLKTLGEIFPNMGSEPGDNPLNFILPAYETLWRVVLSCFIEVTFRKGADPVWREELGRFLADPTKSSNTFHQLGTNPSTSSVPVAFIVKEALRLYPSTKSVYRQFRGESQENPETVVVADIEKCHRITDIWGPDAEHFVPSRWKDLGSEAQKAYMPFGQKPFLCPAQGVYGPRMVGILVAALAAEISAENWTLKLYRDGDKDGTEMKDDEALVSDRNTYDWMEIVRKRA